MMAAIHNRGRTVPTDRAEMPVTFAPGDRPPNFVAPARHNPAFAFDSVAGRYVVLTFVGSASHPGVAEMLAALGARKDLFDDRHASVIALTIDRRDLDTAEPLDSPPGLHLLNDEGARIAEAYGVASAMPERRRATYSLTSFILDPNLRVLAVLPVGQPAQHATTLMGIIAALPNIADQARPAPVLVLPRVFEPELCRALIAHYERFGGEVSGFMREEGGMTVGVVDDRFKRRRDCRIEDPALIAEIRSRLERRLVPEIRRAFNFNATRLERYIVAAYDAEEGGFFRAHRDNTTRGTAHRRFAVTINLNAHAYDGGDLSFPEFGPQTYRAPTGGACVFSCSLLHEARPVTRGRRYAFLPFLYDEAAEKLREENQRYVATARSAPSPTDGPVDDNDGIPL